MSSKQKSSQKAVRRVKTHNKTQTPNSTKKQIIKIIASLALIILLAFAVAILEGTTEMNLTTVQIGNSIFWIDWPEFYQFLLKPIIFFVIIFLFAIFLSSIYKYFKIGGTSGIGYKP